MMSQSAESSGNKATRLDQDTKPAATETTATASATQKPKPHSFTVNKEELKARLSPLQYQVTQNKATEKPGTGIYDKFYEKGAYQCVVCDQELFRSDTKYNSGCGWPAFWEAADKNRLKFVKDYSLVGGPDLLRIAANPNLVRLEVLCANCGAHLGHKFDDGPIAKGGKRYCINSASLKFVPAAASQSPPREPADNKT